LILWVLMNLTISAPSIKLSIFMLFHILHTLSILTGPNIFFNTWILLTLSILGITWIIFKGSVRTKQYTHWIRYKN
jgi:hypothetical protein